MLHTNTSKAYKHHNKNKKRNTQTTHCVTGDKSHLNMHRNPKFTSESACKLVRNTPIPNLRPFDLLIRTLHPLGSLIAEESPFSNS